LRWAHRVRDRFTDGQLYVNLRGYDPGFPVTVEYALDHFLRALNVRASDIPPDMDAKASMYRSLVAEKSILIVLDNAATVTQVRPLLPGSERCLVVVTSRSSLPGLAVRDGAQRIAVKTLTDDEAVTLLRAVTVRYRTEDSADDLAELARLCARLPLALRIAAERAAGRPKMPLSELIQDLRDESALWDALSTENDEEADAVRTVFAWSYRALPKSTARLFRLLGLHPGPQFTLAAAAALAGQSPSKVRSQVDDLIRANLLEHICSDCYQFHDLLRAYAADQVHHEESQEEQHAALHRILSWYLAAAHAAKAMIAPGGNDFTIELDPRPSDIVPPTFPDYAASLAWYEANRTNLMTATSTAASTGFDRIAWQITAVLARVFTARDSRDAWLDIQRKALDAAERTGDRYGQAVILDRLGITARVTRRLREAANHHRVAMEIFEELGDQFGLAKSISGLGNVSLFERDLEQARNQFMQALLIAQSIDHRSLIGVGMLTLGGISFELNHLTDAVSYLDQAVQIHHELDERREEVVALRWLAAAQRELGDHANSRRVLARGLAHAHDEQDERLESNLLIELGLLQIADREFADALTSSQRAATISRRLGDRSEEAQALNVTGRAYRHLGRLDDAAAFNRRAVMIQRELADRWKLATTLADLADALDEGSRPNDALSIRREVAELLRKQSGPRALALLKRIEQQLGNDR
ncbi:MAG TPA: tetratricopeptide repeat protein, partial [Longimicrobiales bacterium]|nr:tetratricopeptide repeat protein [Longimicrobiales bacterium]